MIGLPDNFRMTTVTRKIRNVKISHSNKDSSDNSSRSSHSIDRLYIFHPKEWIASALMCCVLLYVRFVRPNSNHTRLFSDGSQSFFESARSAHDVHNLLKYQYCDVDKTILCIQDIYKPFEQQLTNAAKDKKWKETSGKDVQHGSQQVRHHHTHKIYDTDERMYNRDDVYILYGCQQSYGAPLVEMFALSPCDGHAYTTSSPLDGCPSTTKEKNNRTEDQNQHDRPQRRDLRFKKEIKEQHEKTIKKKKRHRPTDPTKPPAHLKCSLRNLVTANYGDFTQDDVAEEFLIVHLFAKVMVETTERTSNRFSWAIENRGFYSDEEREVLIEYYLNYVVDLFSPMRTNTSTSRAVQGQIVENVFKRSELMKMLQRAAKPFRSNRHIKHVVSEMVDYESNRHSQSQSNDNQNPITPSASKKKNQSSSASSTDDKVTASRPGEKRRRLGQEGPSPTATSRDDDIESNMKRKSKQHLPQHLSLATSSVSSSRPILPPSVSSLSSSATTKVEESFTVIDSHYVINHEKSQSHYFYPRDLDQCMYSHFENHTLATRLCADAMKAAKTKLWQLNAFPVSTDFVVMTHFGFLSIHLVCLFMLLQSCTLKKRYVKKMNAGWRRLEEELNDPVLRASLDQKARQLYDSPSDQEKFFMRLHDKLGTWDSSIAASQHTLKYVKRIRSVLLLTIICNVTVGVVLTIFHEGAKTRFLESLLGVFFLWTVSYGIPITSSSDVAGINDDEVRTSSVA